MIFRIIFGLILLSNIAYSQNRNPPVSKALPDGVEAHENIIYATRENDRKMSLDLYKPPGPGPFPAVVVVHGGGWFQGSREHFRPLAMNLAANGFVAVTVSYRLSGEAKFPAAIIDCKDAVRFLRKNAEKYALDPGKIGATGLSAGGHLVALLGASGNSDELGKSDAVVQAVVAMGAQTDLLSERIAALSRQATNPHYRPFWEAVLTMFPSSFDSHLLLFILMLKIRPSFLYPEKKTTPQLTPKSFVLNVTNWRSVNRSILSKEHLMDLSGVSRGLMRHSSIALRSSKSILSDV